eukprot:13876-Heterococcus_DN1.PRE.1
MSVQQVVATAKVKTRTGGRRSGSMLSQQSVIDSIDEVDQLEQDQLIHVAQSHARALRPGVGRNFGGGKMPNQGLRKC